MSDEMTSPEKENESAGVGVQSATEFRETEAQKKALEEMSAALLEKLHAMVKEQEERVREFAERTHSLSSLPQGIRVLSEQIKSSLPPRETNGENLDVLDSGREAGRIEAPQPVRKRQELRPTYQQYMPQNRGPRDEVDEQKDVKKKADGLAVTIVVVIIFIIVRSCS